MGCPQYMGTDIAIRLGLLGGYVCCFLQRSHHTESLFGRLTWCLKSIGSGVLSKVAPGRMLQRDGKSIHHDSRFHLSDWFSCKETDYSGLCDSMWKRIHAWTAFLNVGAVDDRMKVGFKDWG